MIVRETIRPASDFASGEPGIYRDVPFAEYAAFKAVNASLLKALCISPAHAFDCMNRPDEPKRHFAFGQASHTWLLEPHRFSDHVCVAERCAALKKDGQRCSNNGLHRYGGAWYCGVKGHLPGPADELVQAVVTDDEFAQMQLTSAQMCRHDGVMQILTSDGENELTVLARHEETGLLLKSRLDLFRPQFKLIGDLKTCRSAAYKLFASDMAKLGYDLQAAFYTHVAKLAGLDVEHFAFIALEKTRPFLPDAFRVVDHLIEAAWGACERLLREFKQCQEAGEWPGYSNEFRDIDVPTWRYETLFGDDA